MENRKQNNNNNAEFEMNEQNEEIVLYLLYRNNRFIVDVN